MSYDPNDEDRNRMFLLMWPIAAISIGVILLSMTGCATVAPQQPPPEARLVLHDEYRVVYLTPAQVQRECQKLEPRWVTQPVHDCWFPRYRLGIVPHGTTAEDIAGAIRALRQQQQVPGEKT